MKDRLTTTRKILIFNFILEYKKANQGNSPSFREIGDGCGIESTSLIDYYLKLLIKDGLITRKGKRSIQIVGARFIYD